MTGYATLTNDI